MKLQLLSPESSKTVTVSWLEINTKAGNFIIQPGHGPMLLSLQPNQPLHYCLENGKQETITPKSGIVEVTRDQVIVLLKNNDL